MRAAWRLIINAPNSSKSATFTLWGAAATLMVRAVGAFWCCPFTSNGFEGHDDEECFCRRRKRRTCSSKPLEVCCSFGGGNFQTKRLQLKHLGNCMLARNLADFPPFFFPVQHKTTETSRYFPPWGAYEVHRTSLSLICVKSANQQDRFRQFQVKCYHTRAATDGAEMRAHPGGGKISSRFRRHGSHITFILCAGDWGLIVPVGWFSLIYFFFLTVRSIPWHGNEELSCFLFFFWTISFSYNTNKAKTSTMLKKKKKKSGFTIWRA